MSFYDDKGAFPSIENDQFIKIRFYVINNDNYVCMNGNIPPTIRLSAICVIIQVKGQKVLFHFLFEVNLTFSDCAQQSPE